LALVQDELVRPSSGFVDKLGGLKGALCIGDLLQTLADCPKARSASIHDRCKVVYEGLMGWLAPTLLRSPFLTDARQEV
jgi:hypothetical protein